MTPAELRDALRAKRKELRAALPAMRARARARLDQVPEVQRARRRRQLRRAIGLGLIALLLLFIRCDCGPGQALAPKKVEPVVPAPKVKPKVAVKPGPKKPLVGQGQKQLRGAFGVGPPAPPTWIDEFQLQVAARSPRLALCFTGVDRPGALRWAASVNPKSGAVSDHELELVGGISDLGKDQEACLTKVLSNPPYKLTAPEKEALPNRVSLVIEF